MYFSVTLKMRSDNPSWHSSGVILLFLLCVLPIHWKLPGEQLAKIRISLSCQLFQTLGLELSRTLLSIYHRFGGLTGPDEQNFWNNDQVQCTSRYFLIQNISWDYFYILNSSRSIRLNNFTIISTQTVSVNQLKFDL